MEAVFRSIYMMKSFQISVIYAGLYVYIGHGERECDQGGMNRVVSVTTSHMKACSKWMKASPEKMRTKSYDVAENKSDAIESPAASYDIC